MLRVSTVALRPLHERLDQDTDIPDRFVALPDEIQRVVGIAHPDRQVQHGPLAEIGPSALQLPVPSDHPERIQEDRPAAERAPAPRDDRVKLSPRVDHHRRALPAALLRRQVVQRDRRSLAGPRRSKGHGRTFEAVSNQSVRALADQHTFLPCQALQPAPLDELGLSVEFRVRLLAPPHLPATFQHREQPLDRNH